METLLLKIIPVLPSSDIERDVAWYREKTGFELFYSDKMYAVLIRGSHADTPGDPLLGGSVIRILVKNIEPLFQEFIQRGTVTEDAFKANTPWETNEFGFFDLNNNAVFIMEDLA